jgi:hypothetical protein
MRPFRCTPLVLAAAMLAGCSTTNLDVKPVSAGSSGIVYSLPFTQFTETVSWRASCERPPAAAPTPAAPAKHKSRKAKPLAPAKTPSGMLKVTPKVTLAAASLPDGEHTYAIDPNSIQTATSVASLTVTFQPDSNQLASINEAVEDQSATVITNVATGVAQIGLAVVSAGGAAGLDGGPPPPPAPVLCNTTTQGEVDAAKAAGDTLTKDTAALGDATDNLKALTAKIASMGGNVDPKTKRLLSAALDRIAALTDQTASDQSAVSDALKPITATQTIVWPLDSHTGVEAPTAGLTSDQLKKWTDQAANAPDGSTVSFSLERLGTYGRDPAALATPATEGQLKGLRYRTPAQGRLLACSKLPCNSLTPLNALAKLDGPVAQLGYVAAFPVATPAFGSTTFAASFSASGFPTSVGYAQKTAPAVAASGAFSSAATSLSPVITALGPTQELARKAAKLEALKKLRDDQAANSQAQADAPYAAETALLNAQIAQLTAQQSLAKLTAVQTTATATAQ